MSRINDKLGLRPSGSRARLNSLSGVACPECHHHYVVSAVIHEVLRWSCGFCAHAWTPTLADVQRYNGRVRERDRLTVPR